MNQEEVNAAVRLLNQRNVEDIAVRIIEECPEPEERAAQLFKYAIQLVENSDRTGAQAVLAKLEAGSNTPLVHLYAEFVRAILMEARGDLLGALNALRDVERELPNNAGPFSDRVMQLAADLCTRIGMLSLELHDPHGALERLTKVRETPFVSYLIGTCYFDLAEYETAIDYLARALYSATDDRIRLLASYQLGVAEYRRGRYGEALRHLSRCTTLLGCGSLPSGLIYEAIVASAKCLGDQETLAQYTPLLAMHVTGFNIGHVSGPGQS